METFSLDLSIENVYFKQIFFFFVLRFITNCSIFWIFSKAITGAIFILITGDHVILGMIIAIFIVEYENLVILIEKYELSIFCIA